VQNKYQSLDALPLPISTHTKKVNQESLEAILGVQRVVEKNKAGTGEKTLAVFQAIFLGLDDHRF
jgi:hypothetical protein